jgi:hypothetical protein
VRGERGGGDMLVLDSRDLKKRCSLWSEREREREREWERVGGCDCNQEMEGRKVEWQGRKTAT